MNNSVLIVCLPLNPFRFDGLRPRKDAAMLAAAIHATGTLPRILDLASLESVSTLLSHELLAGVPLPSSDGSTPAQIDFSERLLASPYLAVLTRSVRESLGRELPGAVVFLARSRFDLRIARSISATLGIALESCAVFQRDVVALGNQTAERFEALREALAGSPQALNGFDPQIYQTLRDQTKVRVFEIGSNARVADSISGLFLLLEETAALNRWYGTRAFHFGPSVVGNQFYHVASELIARSARLQYSANAAMADYPVELAAVASASGCVAASFLVGSGSQRLIDEHFRFPFQLHSAERTIRAFAQSGIHTRVELTYPCALDDFHTRDETMRFVARCMPHALHISSPATSRYSPAPSLWQPAERRRRSLERAIQKLGVESDIAPEDVLLASLAGFAGRERQFKNHAARALVTGNIDALGTLVEDINAAARGEAEATFWKSFGSEHRMVGN